MFSPGFTISFETKSRTRIILILSLLTRLYSFLHICGILLCCFALQKNLFADQTDPRVQAYQYLVSLGGCDMHSRFELNGVTINAKEIDAILQGLPEAVCLEFSGARFSSGQFQRLSIHEKVSVIKLAAAELSYNDIYEFNTAVSCRDSAYEQSNNMFLDFGDHTNSPLSEAEIEKLRAKFPHRLRFGYVSKEESQAREFLRSVGGQLDGKLELKVRLENTMIGEKEVDAILKLQDVEELSLDGSRFATAQFQRLVAINHRHSLHLSLRRTQVTLDELQTFLDQDRFGEITKFSFGFYWESPVAEREVKILESLPNVICDHVSKSELDDILLHQIQQLAQPPTRGSYSVTSNGVVYMDSRGLFMDMIQRGNMGTLPYFASTEADYSHLIAQNDPSPAALIWRASHRLKRGFVDEARQDLSLVIGRPSEETSALEKKVAHYLLGRAYAAKSQYQLACDNYSQARELGLVHDEFVRDHVIALRESGQFADALDKITQLIQRMESSPGSISRFIDLADVYHDRAAIHHACENNEIALADCNRCLEIDPDHIEAIDTRAAIYDWLYELELAIADYTKLIELNSSSAEHYFHRGECWVQKCVHENAIYDFTMCLGRNPEHLGALYARANLWRDLGDYARCKADIDRILNVDDQNAAALCFLAHLTSRCPDVGIRESEDAIWCATKACKLTNWQSACCVAALANAQADRQLFDDAIRNAERAVALTADSPLDRMVYEAFLRSFQNRKVVRYKTASRQSSIGRQCDVIEKICAAGGRVKCRFDDSRVKVSVEIYRGEIEQGSLSRAFEPKPVLPATIAAELYELDSLDTLTLVGFHLNAEAQRHLAKIPHLRRMQLSDCDLSEANQFSKFPFSNLKALELRDTRVSESFVAVIAKMPKLSVLKVIRCDLDREQIFTQLISNHNLEELAVESKYLEDEHLQHLSRLPHLNRVLIEFGHPHTDKPLSRNAFGQLARMLGNRQLRIEIKQYFDLPFADGDVDWLRQHYPNLTIEWHDWRHPRFKSGSD